MNSISQPEEFFDTASDFYDKMTGDSLKGITKKQNFYRSVVTENYSTAADIGCGSGKDSIALSLLGLRVTGFDVSKRMVETAIENNKQMNGTARFVNAPFSQSAGSFDVITCFGNTLALMPEADVKTLFNDVAATLTPGGRFTFQILNYVPLLQRKDKNIVISGSAQTSYIRFYEYTEDGVLFNILSSAESGKKLITTKLYPHTGERIKELLQQTGFPNIEFFGNISKNPFSPDLSPDLIGVAEKEKL